MHRLRSSIRARIVAATVAATFLGFIAVGFLVINGVRRDARAELDGRLTRRADALALSGASGLLSDDRSPLLFPFRGAVLAVSGVGVRFGERGRVLQSYGAVPSHTPTAQERGLRTVFADGALWRIAAAPLRDRRGAVVEVIAPLDDVQAQARRTRRRLLLVGIIGALLAGLVAALAAGRAIASLGRLAATAESVAETERLDLRVPTGGPTEVDAVAGALNRLLERLERSTAARERALAATRRFAADAGHELRTPLATLQTTLETLHRNPGLPQAERAGILQDALAEQQRLTALVLALQTLTRAEGGAMGDESHVDISDIAADAAAACVREGATIALELSPVPQCVASPTGVRLMIDNLLQNAVRYAGRPDAPAEITLAVHRSADGDAIEVAVDDDGPGIPADEREAAPQRFHRGTTATGDGSGLGLSIVAQQVALLRGTLELGDSPAGGLRARLRIPVPEGGDGEEVP